MLLLVSDVLFDTTLRQGLLKQLPVHCCFSTMYAYMYCTMFEFY